jgi:FKBP-type peptidyl-prolyl cis-trans isomerase
MKNLISSLAIAVICCGCVVGPEEVAAEKAKNDAAEAEMAAREPVTVAEKEDPQGVVPANASLPADGKTFQKTNNGLKYRIIEEGTGKRPGKTSTVVCNYRGWLDNGREFDSSYKRGEPAEFALNQVIPGWTEGLQLIKEGGKIELEVPSRLGYGESGMPPVIPPNSKLHFEVELVKVK